VSGPFAASFAPAAQEEQSGGMTSLPRLGVARKTLPQKGLRIACRFVLGAGRLG